MSETRTGIQPYPGQGQPGAQPTPQTTIITPTLQAETGKLTSEIGQKLSSVVSRKIAQRVLPVLLFATLFAAAAIAQVPPYTYPITLGTASVQVLAADPLRKQILFHNPNSTALVAVCPVGPGRNGAATVTAVINGAGCITILPYDRVLVGAQSSAAPGSPQSAMPSAWVGIASAPSSALTILEWE